MLSKDVDAVLDQQDYAERQYHHVGEAHAVLKQQRQASGQGVCRHADADQQCPKVKGNARGDHTDEYANHDADNDAGTGDVVCGLDSLCLGLRLGL